MGAAGLGALALAWLTPLPAWAGQAFWAHMTLHMLVVAVAAPLLALGVTGGRFDPARRAPALFAPIPASFVELVVVWAWHVPAFHHAARNTLAGFVVEQASFLASGLWLWLAVLAPGRRAEGVIALLLTSMHMTLLGALIALGPRTLFAHCGGASALSPLADQHLGGAIMLLVGGVVYLAGGLGLTRGLLRCAG